MTRKEISRAVRLYRAGHTVREIAAQLGYERSGQYVWRCIRHQVEIRRCGPRGRTDVTDDLIITLRENEQLPWRAIAETVGMSKTGVQLRYRSSRGVPRDRTAG